MSTSTQTATRVAFVSQGPVLFTCPHGHAVYRHTDQHTGKGRRELHRREAFTSLLAATMASRTNGSLIAWRGTASSESRDGGRDGGTLGGENVPMVYATSSLCHGQSRGSAVVSELDLDANFLRPCQYTMSPWHLALLEFRRTWVQLGVPMLHVDIHGKVDRRSDLDIDIGIKPIQVLWQNNSGPHNSDFCRRMKMSLYRGLTGAVKGIKGKSQAPTAAADPLLSWGVEMEPALDGYWGTGDSMPTTIIHQSATLGIPSVMLEFPYSVRKALCSPDHSHALEGICQSIMETYKEVVVPAGVTSQAQASSTMARPEVNNLLTSDALHLLDIITGTPSHNIPLSEFQEPELPDDSL
ncbi:hypothetical protein Pelo_16463 [Pelomyxa schiedti]|nr:hypothetical protein Pelo_16458 [Pelomyxa schiedti]KAH3732711.1 hypothetical protein Pelo_16463 [Pelomyxa schiedti]